VTTEKGKSAPEKKRRGDERGENEWRHAENGGQKKSLALKGEGHSPVHNNSKRQN